MAVEPASRIPFLQSDKVDLILANMTVTRSGGRWWTSPTRNLKVAVQVLVPEGSDAKKLDDLAGKRLIVTTGTTADIWLTRNHPDWKVLKSEKNTESLQALAQGRGDAYAQDNLVLFSWAWRTRAIGCCPRSWAGRPHRPGGEEGQYRAA